MALDPRAALGDLIDSLNAIDGVEVQRDRPLGPLCTYRVGGAASLYVEVGTKESLQRLAERVADQIDERPIEILLVGNGSNLLVADTGFDGLAIRLVGDFGDISIDGTSVRAGGAALLPVVARQSVAAGLAGFEWAVGVPGTVGGGVRMNAGGHGSDLAASLLDADVVRIDTGESAHLLAADLEFSYRHSAIRPTDVVVQAHLRLVVGDRAQGEATLGEIVRWRREHQPGGANAGSVFTNPPGDSAGRLIDASGLRGLRVGSAEVSLVHANFIQADPGGAAADILALMGAVQARVEEQHGVHLVPETRLIGFGDERTDLVGGDS